MQVREVDRGGVALRRDPSRSAVDDRRSATAAVLVARRFAEALMAGDAAAAAGCFGVGGRILTPDGTEVGGVEAIGALLGQMVSSQMRLRISVGRVVTVGDVALATQYWKRSMNSGEGRYKDSSRASLVLSREGDRWAILIASPWGELGA